MASKLVANIDLVQSARRPKKPNSSVSSVLQPTKADVLPKRKEAPASRPQAPPLLPSCPTSTYLRTRFSSCRTCQTIPTLKLSLACLAALKDSVKCVWCQAVAVLLSWSTRTRLVPSVPRRIRLASRLTAARISRSRTRGSKKALYEGTFSSNAKGICWLARC